MAELMNDVMENEVAVATEKKTRDPLAKFNELSADQQELVQGVVDDVVGQIGGEDVNLALLLGVLDKLNALKKTAREIAKENEKKEKEIAKEQAVARGNKLKSHLTVGDRISYFMATNKITIKDVVITKITEKSARIEVTADTTCIDKDGNEILASDIPTLKLGMKSVAFGKILTLNDDDVAEMDL